MSFQYPSFLQKTLSCELESGNYPPEGHYKDISPDGKLPRALDLAVFSVVVISLLLGAT